MEMQKLNTPDISDRISDICITLNNLKYTPEKIAITINDLLVLDGVPLNLISSAWDYFAKQKGVDTRFMYASQEMV